MNIKQKIGLLGVIALFFGVFMPIVSIPFMGSVNYFENGKGEGTIILLLAVVSLILVLNEMYAGLWFTGTGSFAMLFFTFITFHSEMAKARTNMEMQLAGNPFRELADAAMQTVQFQWGWALLVTGAGLLIASAAINVEPIQQYLEVEEHRDDDFKW